MRLKNDHQKIGSWTFKSKKPGTITAAEEYIRLSEELLEDRWWFKLPMRLLPHLSDGETIVLGYLMNWSNVVGAIHRRKGWDGWFYCEQKRMKSELGYSIEKQDRVLRSLRQKKFIRHDRRGVGAKRYFKINMRRIVEACKKSIIDDDLQDSD